MKRLILLMTFVLMIAIFITLLIVPVNLSAGTTQSTGSIYYVGTTPGCNCTTDKEQCYCLTNNFEEN